MLMGLEIPDRQSNLRDQAVLASNWNIEQANAAESHLSQALLIPASIFIGLSPFSLDMFQNLPVGKKWLIFLSWVLAILSIAAGVIQFKLNQEYHRKSARTFRQKAIDLKVPNMPDQAIDEIVSTFEQVGLSSSSVAPLVIQAISLALAVAFFVGVMYGQLFG